MIVKVTVSTCGGLILELRIGLYCTTPFYHFTEAILQVVLI